MGPGRVPKVGGWGDCQGRGGGSIWKARFLEKQKCTYSKGLLRGWGSLAEVYRAMGALDKGGNTTLPARLSGQIRLQKGSELAESFLSSSHLKRIQLTLE